MTTILCVIGYLAAGWVSVLAYNKTIQESFTGLVGAIAGIILVIIWPIWALGILWRLLKYLWPPYVAEKIKRKERKGSEMSVSRRIYTQETMDVMQRERDGFCEQNMKTFERYKQVKAQNEQLKKSILKFGKNPARFDWGVLGRIDELEQELEKLRWIPVSEGLPEIITTVWMNHRGMVDIGHLDQYGKWWSSRGAIRPPLHWMYPAALPEARKT